MKVFPFNFVGRESSPVESLFLEEFKLSDSESIFHRDNDVGLLFNQERIAKSVGVDTVNSWIKSMSNFSDTSLAKLRDKVGDNALLKFVKSRHLQTPSELLTWSQYLNDVYGEELSSLRCAMDDVEPTEPVEPSPVEPAPAAS